LVQKSGNYRNSTYLILLLRVSRSVCRYAANLLTITNTTTGRKKRNSVRHLCFNWRSNLDISRKVICRQQRVSFQQYVLPEKLKLTVCIFSATVDFTACLKDCDA